MKTSNLGALLACGALLGALAWSGCATRVVSTTPAELTTCTYGGQEYAVGDSFRALDGCNTCRCMENGLVACTRMACRCNPAREPHRVYLSTDRERCARIRFDCDPGMRPFFNACGCGCEPARARSP